MTLALREPGPRCAISRRSRVSRAGGLALVAALSLASIGAAPTAAVAAATPLDLGRAGAYSALGSSVTSAGATVLQLKVGTLSTTVTEAPPVESSGREIASQSAIDAMADLDAAYARAAALPPTSVFAGDQDNQTFQPGTHFIESAFVLSGTMTLDGGGQCGKPFIFQVNGALTTAAVSSIVLQNGAQAANVYWQVKGAVGTGARSHFVGSIMATGHITLGDSSDLNGRALSSQGLTFVNNRIYLADAVDPCPPAVVPDGLPVLGAPLAGSGARGSAVTVNPMIGSRNIVPSTITFLDARSRPATRLIVPHEGTWTVNPAQTTVTFTPLSTFFGPVNPVNIVGSNRTGQKSAPGAVRISYPTLRPGESGSAGGPRFPFVSG